MKQVAEHMGIRPDVNITFGVYWPYYLIKECPLRSLTDINSEIELDTKTLETLWHTWICLPILSERY